jgi:hypothetical protein
LPEILLPKQLSLLFQTRFRDNLSVSYFSEKAESIFISLQDVSGKSSFSKKCECCKRRKHNSHVFENAALSSGIYFLRLQTGENILNLKVSKR